ncbi:glycosyltransferase family 9 protein [Vibrio panuliri]|uniref:Uncharacterized protein n=1 Tax=Vibrio panuliri TaxID=1381081 RepID=A0ABX3FM95_9VIBR|nr:glycosyltransferase family 9 protein [Vibrio panuliri]KAB1459074.1 glycosyltransferase family 9 protein [Vibrio panuliri]OLQ93883.1 hypothetical protein BIY20_08050 [Vibrio panuliri]
MNVLIVHTFGLGDTIMFTPALQELIAFEPNVKIDFLIKQKHSVGPIRRCKNVNEIYTFEGGLYQKIRLLNKLSKNNYDYIVHTSGNSVSKISLLLLLIKAKNKVGEFSGFKIPWYRYQTPSDFKQHRVISNFKLVSCLTGKDVLTKKTTYYSDQVVNKMVSNSNAVIGLHPGCNKANDDKRWPIDNYLALLSKFDKKVKWLVFLGPDELSLKEDFESVDLNIEIVIGDMDYVFSRMGELSMMVTNDSGLGHLASCYDIPCVTIFTKKSLAQPHKIKPYCSHSIVVDFKSYVSIDSAQEVELVEKSIRDLV